MKNIDVLMLKYFRNFYIESVIFVIYFFNRKILSIIFIFLFTTPLYLQCSAFARLLLSVVYQVCYVSQRKKLEISE